MRNAVNEKFHIQTNKIQHQKGKKTKSNDNKKQKQFKKSNKNRMVDIFQVN